MTRSNNVTDIVASYGGSSVEITRLVDMRLVWNSDHLFQYYANFGMRGVDETVAWNSKVPHIILSCRVRTLRGNMWTKYKAKSERGCVHTQQMIRMFTLQTVERSVYCLYCALLVWFMER